MAPTAGEAVVATAGGDGNVQVFDRTAEQILATLSGHSKKVHGELSVGCVGGWVEESVWQWVWGVGEELLSWTDPGYPVGPHQERKCR